MTISLGGGTSVTFSILACAALLSGCGANDDGAVAGGDDARDEGLGSSVSFTQNQFGVDFTNEDGRWTIYTGCFGPKARGGQNLTVGPGYVARLTLNEPTPDGGKVVLDDEGPLRSPGGHLIGFTRPGHAGLGGFAWHHSRGSAPYSFTFENAWEIAGRICAEDNGGFGVSGATIVDGPRIDTDGSGVLTVDVFFSDGWTAQAPLMRVRYDYRVYASVVKSWMLVTELCDQGQCGSGAPGAAYIAEPKFVSAVNGGGYRRLAIFNRKQEIASNSVSTNASCIYTGKDPTKSTGQCDGDFRVRARFDYGSADSGTVGGCDSTKHFCLNTVMRAYAVNADGGITPGNRTWLWENSGYGTDQWARLSADRQAVNAKDSPLGGASWGCHGGSPGSEQQRRWEMGGTKNPSGQYGYASFGFHGWEAGTGCYDCEPLTRRFGPKGESFAIHAQYSINDGWSMR